MTKKHYEAIAGILKKYYTCETTQGNLLAQQGFFELTCDLADYFASDNPRFDRDKFLSACGVETPCTECEKTNGMMCDAHNLLHS